MIQALDEGKPVDLSKMPPPPEQNGMSADLILFLLFFFLQYGIDLKWF